VKIIVISLVWGYHWGEFEVGFLDESETCYYGPLRCPVASQLWIPPYSHQVTWLLQRSARTWDHCK